jgi:hypothetical protein
VVGSLKQQGTDRGLYRRHVSYRRTSVMMPPTCGGQSDCIEQPTARRKRGLREATD